MSWFKKDKERERYYLLPGQGGRSLRRKNQIALIWSVVIGLLVAAAVAGAIFWTNNRLR